MQPIYTRLGVVIIFSWYLGNTVYSDWDLTLDLSVSRFYRACSVLPCQFAFKSERGYSFFNCESTFLPRAAPVLRKVALFEDFKVSAALSL